MVWLHMVTWFRQKGEQAKNDRQNQNDYFNQPNNVSWRIYLFDIRDD